MARKSKKRSHRADRKRATLQDKEHSPLPALPSFGDLPKFTLSSTAPPSDSSRKRSIDQLSDGEDEEPSPEDESSPKRLKPDDEVKDNDSLPPSADSDGWHHVTYKKNNTRRDSSYPEFIISSQRIHTWTRIADLQSLIFHLLSHDAPPGWMLIRNKSAIRRIVYLHVPGLSMDLFDGRVTLSSKTPQNNQPRHNLGEYFPINIKSTPLPAPLHPLSEIFTHILPVRAGGDNLKLYSPVHNMLNVSIEQEEDSNNSSNRKRSRKRKPKPTSRLKITELLLSLDDLIENEYPLHSTYSPKTTVPPLPESWLETDLSTTPERIIQSGSILEGYTLYSLDCEMVKTVSGPTLARISIIDWDGKTILDELVKPDEPIEDYLTPFSGITPQMLKDVTTTFHDIQQKLKNLLNGNAILVGQSLNSDLTALKWRHPWIVDTSVIFDHPRGKPMKPSLKWLSQKYLKKDIQRGTSSTGGHDSVEDARACLDLVKLKLERGKDFGSAASSFESIFTKLAQVQPKSRTGGVVDYGDPEKKYASLAQYIKRVEDDDVVVDGVLTAVNGDDTAGIAPVDFVWAQLKSLNEVRGWNNSYQKFVNQMNAVPITATSPPIEIPEKPNQPEPLILAKAVEETVGRVKRIYDGLPKCSALVVYGGTGDPVEMGRLNAVQAVYRREFKVKKWDECSVRWTDDEDQALRKAVGEARKGIAFLTVK
ncbi:hypothetical protein TWF694_008471 [Orbilia ellipsospora]|uniref:Exonuclease domain-containing protein n=1 Tax=Orbilia ellipsospora TaxID=2528407 RepID=A0AAV9XGL9_9PEZI